MAIETAAERAVFFNSAEFATAVTYTPAGGAGAALSGIWTGEHEVLAAGQAPGISGVPVVLTVADADLPAGAAQGDTVTRAGTDYAVRDLRPDGSGLTRLILEES